MGLAQPVVVAAQPARFTARFTVEPFHRLCEAVPQQRPELIDGEMWQGIAMGSRPTAVVHRLITAIEACLVEKPQAPLQLRVEAPLDLGPTTEAEPDLALVARREVDCWTAHPTAAALVIEAADASLPVTWRPRHGWMPPPGSPAIGWWMASSPACMCCRARRRLRSPGWRPSGRRWSRC
jgi:hypothetical protein